MPCELPPELLREILSPPLLVSDEMFSDSGAVSPFSKVEKSASDVLLVCKSWMRVATPWLYSTVIVRSKAQAKALALALTNNPDFGKFIRRLRIEGAYGEQIWVAVKTAPNITDLCMTLTVWSDVPVTGLVKSLAHINPCRVILTLTPDRPVKNKNHTTLLNALCSRIRSWTRLKTFRFGGNRSILRPWSQTADYLVFPDIVTALCASPDLEEVHLPVLDSSNVTLDITRRLLEVKGRTVTLFKASGDSDSSFMLHAQQLLTRAPIHLLSRIRTAADSDSFDILFNSSIDIAPGALLHTSSDADLWLPNPFYKPLQGIDPLMRHALLTQIFKHALETEPPAQHTYVFQGAGWFDAQRFDSTVARGLFEADQEFKCITIEILITHVYIDREEQAERMLEIILAKPALSTYIRTLHFRHLGQPTTTQMYILERSSHLVEATISLSPVTIEALVRGGSSRTLRKLNLQSPYSTTTSMEPLSIDGFVALEELVINYPFYLPYSTNTSTPEIQGIELPCLRRLQIESAPRDIIDSLIRYRFPMLDYLDCGSSCIDAAVLTPLIMQHGAHVREARLYDISTALCEALPEMVELHWTRPVLDGTILAQSCTTDGHKKLRVLRVFAPIPNAHHRHKLNAQLNAMWTTLLTEVVTSQRFPALEELQAVEGQNMWPVNERDAKRSLWPALAETLELQGIALTDREGRAWRRRLR